MSLIAEAIIEAFGERCPDFDPECHCCKAWAEYDELEKRAADATCATAEFNPPYRPHDLRAVPGSSRDIYELANQLGGWVSPATEDHLAKFLLREAEEASLLADELVRLRRALDAAQAGIEANSAASLD